ncbi:hypothetical protein [Nocardioides sp. KR10-350]|uniref:hypothetical protein n=1 Tax=Nocardioides cheoyonin TaxID=3156615 RepID=UPI0032B473E7
MNLRPAAPRPTALPLDRVRGGRGRSTVPIRPAVSVAVAGLVTLVVHLLFLSRDLSPDEGGYAVVARLWHLPGPYLYGPTWVDRPPGLVSAFALADHLGTYGVRLVAALAATVLVAAVGSAARAVAGHRAAAWSAWTAAALVCSVRLDGQRLDGELLAATCVSLAAALLVHALCAQRHAVALGLLSGAAASAALTMKQSFGDGLVLLAVVLAVGLRRRPDRVRRVAVAAAVGAGVPLLATLLWAAAHGRVRALGHALFGFRLDAAALLSVRPGGAPERLHTMLLEALVTGLALLLVAALAGRVRHLLRGEPLTCGLAAAILVELGGIAAGGGYWDHYLLALVPTTALLVGLCLRHGCATPRLLRRLVRAAVVAAGLSTAVATIPAAYAEHATAQGPAVAGRWLAASARPGDTVVVPFTHAEVIDASGLRPAYPYLWSLPTQVEDPHLRLLDATLTAPTGPTWVVGWNRPESFGLDPVGFDGALDGSYRAVAEVCGHPVWLRDGVTRRLAPIPPDDVCHQPEYPLEHLP